MRTSKSVRQAQLLLGSPTVVSSLFNLGRELVRAVKNGNLRISAFADWERAVATPATTNPLWLMGIMAGLLSVVGIRTLRKALIFSRHRMSRCFLLQGCRATLAK